MSIAIARTVSTCTEWLPQRLREGKWVDDTRRDAAADHMAFRNDQLILNRMRSSRESMAHHMVLGDAAGVRQWLPANIRCGLPQCAVTSDVDALGSLAMRDSNPVLYVVDGLDGYDHSERSDSWYITKDYLPTMCGGVMITVSSVQTMELRPTFETTPYGIPKSITSGSQSRGTPWGCSSYEGVGVSGYKGQVVVLGDAAMCRLTFRAIVDSVYKECSASVEGNNSNSMDDAFITSHYAEAVTLTWISSTVAVITTEYSGCTPMGDIPLYSNKRLNRTATVMGSAAKCALGFTLTEGGGLTTTVPVLSGVYGGGYTEWKRVRTNIRKGLRNYGLAIIMRTIASANRPMIMTDNTCTDTSTKTADLIEFLSDEKELAALQPLAKEILQSLPGRYNYDLRTAAPLKFIRFPHAQNPNEHGHPIVGGALVIKPVPRGDTLPKQRSTRL